MNDGDQSSQWNCGLICVVVCLVGEEGGFFSWEIEQKEDSEEREEKDSEIR